jgi:DNA-binding XRE family transcriptional regulator
MATPPEMRRNARKTEQFVDVPTWLALEPIPDRDGDGLLKNGTHGPDDGKVRYPKTAAKISALMARAGLDQTKLAREIRMQQGFVGKIERGESAPSLATTFELVNVFRLKVDPAIDVDDVVDRKEVIGVGKGVRARRSVSARRSRKK